MFLRVKHFLNTVSVSLTGFVLQAEDHFPCFRNYSVNVLFFLFFFSISFFPRDFINLVHFILYSCQASVGIVTYWASSDRQYFFCLGLSRPFQCQGADDQLYYSTSISSFLDVLSPKKHQVNGFILIFINSRTNLWITYMVRFPLTTSHSSPENYLFLTFSVRWRKS